MALPATHIRFAAELVGRYPIRHFKAYIAGTLYPDSRRFSGISRDKTHADIHLETGFPDSDFTFGWHIHCLCDRIQEILHTPMLPQIMTLDNQSQWVSLAAAKMVQDQHDMQQVDLNPLLDSLDYAEAPQGEHIQQIMRYHRLIQDTYRGKERLGPADYHGLWTGVGVSSDQADSLVTVMQQIQGDKALAKRICASYDMMRKRVPPYPP